MSKNKVVVLAIVIVLALIGALTLSWGTDEGTIKIGLVAPLSGSLANIGESSQGGAELAALEINAAGGVLGRKLELVIEDDACSARGAAAVSKLINIDKVVAISGPDCSSSANAALPIAAKSGTPVVLRWASAPGLTALGENIFRVYPSDALQGKFVAEFMAKQGFKNVAILGVTNTWSQGIVAVFERRFQELGGTITSKQMVSEDSRDLRAELAKIKSSSNNALFAPLHEATGIVGLSQARELELNLPIVGGDVFESKAVVESPGAEGIMFSVAVVGNPSNFQERVGRQTGKDGSAVTAPLGYDSVMAIAEAIRKADSTDPAKVREALQNLSIPGVGTQTIEFGADRELKDVNFEIKIIKNGSAHPLAQ